jgi:site-specific recombinase XerD
VDATLHQLRHRFATRLYAECGDLRVVQELMGHCNPKTTAGYAAYSAAAAVSAVCAIAA